MDVNLLLKKWNNNKVGLARFLGEVLSYIPNFSDNMSRSFGEKLFERLKMCDRIDFLYDHEQHVHLDETQFKKTISFGLHDGVVFIEDIRGDFGFLNLMLLRHLDTPNEVYAARLYVSETYPSFLTQFWTDKTPTFANVKGEKQKVVRSNWQPEETEYTNVCEHDETFWNFVRKGKKLEIWQHSEGFSDLTTTRRVAKIVEWTSNMLGFEYASP